MKKPSVPSLIVGNFDAPEISLLCYNLCRAAKSETGGFSFLERMPRILALIQKHDADILMLQECRRLKEFGEEDCIVDFLNLLAKPPFGYVVEEFPTNGTALCLNNVICYKRSKFVLFEKKLTYLSDTPMSPSGYGEGSYGRAVGNIKLYCAQDGLIDMSRIIAVCVFHLSVSDEYRTKEAEQVRDHLYPYDPCVFGGDFNTFGPNAAKQRALIFGHKDIVDFCKPDSVKGTWLGWHADFPIKKGEVGELFDGIGGRDVLQTAPTIVDTDDYLPEEESAEHEYNFCPSDHAALYTTFTFTSHLSRPW